MTVVLVAVARVAIAEVHVPRADAVVLSRTPVATAGTQIDISSAVASV